jgi:hypothetical protein
MPVAILALLVVLLGSCTHAVRIPGPDPEGAATHPPLLMPNTEVHRLTAAAAGATCSSSNCR